MAPKHIELHQVNRITIDTVGTPGQRTFLLQVSDAIDTITLKIEKEQARVLAQKSTQLLEDIQREHPSLGPDASPAPLDAELMLQPPLDPLFAVGQMGLGYDSGQDRIIVATQELMLEETEEGSSAQFWVTRTQLKALSEHVLIIIDQGRPNCPLCGRPIDAEGHFCPQRNGHDKKILQ